MKIEIAPGDELVVILEGTDGEFRISFDLHGDQKVRVVCDMADDKGRGGDGNEEIYCEDFNKPVDGLDKEDLEVNP